MPELRQTSDSTRSPCDCPRVLDGSIFLRLRTEIERAAEERSRTTGPAVLSVLREVRSLAIGAEG